MSASWPTSVSTDSTLYVAVNELQNNLSGAINSAVTTVGLNSTTSFPAVGLVLIDNEVIKYTGISSNNLTGCTRGFDGTTAASHSSAAVVSFAFCAQHHNGLKDEIIAIETSLNLTASKAIATNVSGRLVATSVTDTELGYISGVTSAVQTQLNAKLTNPLTGNLAAGGFKLTGLAAGSSNGDSLRYEQLIGVYLPLAGATVTGATTFSAAAGNPVHGTNTNDNAGAGYIGEYVSSWATVTNAPTNGQWGDLTSISLTAGDWDVSLGQQGSINGSTTTRMLIGVGKTSGNNAPDITGQAGDDSLDIGGLTTSSAPSGSLAAVRVSLASTTTIYYKMVANYSAGVPQFRGRISARRVR